MNKSEKIYFLNCAATSFIAMVVLVAFILQIALHELPCPLCLLQRYGMLAMAVGLLGTIVRANSPRFYGLTIIAAVYTFIVAMRQVFLHILPGDAGYGDPVFGIHLYTWVAVMSLLMVGYCSVILVIMGSDKQLQLNNARHPLLSCMGKMTALLVFIAVSINVVNAFVECGPYACPDNPISYWLFNPH